MGCFNILFIILLGGIYLLWPDLMQVEGFWFSFIAIWLCFFIGHSPSGRRRTPDPTTNVRSDNELKLNLNLSSGQKEKDKKATPP